MMRKFRDKWKHFSNQYLLPFLVSTLGLGLIKLIALTCRFKIHGLEAYKKIASKEKCILVFWHNQIILAPFIVSRNAGEFKYAVLTSNSRDGALISHVVESFSIGRTIRVPHHSRHQALKETIRTLEEGKEIVIVTPDGPRGPCYEVKPGVAMAALETGAYIAGMKWRANKYWTLKTWDRMKIPKPFSTIEVMFEKPMNFDKSSTSIEDIQKALQQVLRNEEK